MTPNQEIGRRMYALFASATDGQDQRYADVSLVEAWGMILLEHFPSVEVADLEEIKAAFMAESVMNRKQLSETAVLA